MVDGVELGVSAALGGVALYFFFAPLREASAAIS